MGRPRRWRRLPRFWMRIEARRSGAHSQRLHDLRVRVAVERYQSGDVSVNQAARIGDVSLEEWFEIASERNLTTQLSPDDLETDAEAARDL